jgi:hypothetical protein
MVLLLVTALIASGCGGGSSDRDGTAKSSIAVEPSPKATTLDACLTASGYEFQREDANHLRATRNGRSFIDIREFGSESEAAAYDGQLTVPAHIQVGTRVAGGGSADDLKGVERCLRGAPQK